MIISQPVVGFLTSATHDLIARHAREVTGLKVIVKSAGENRNNTTAEANDADFYWDAEIGEYCHVLMLLHVTGPAAGGFRCQFTWPAGGGLYWIFGDTLSPVAAGDAPQLFQAEKIYTSFSGSTGWEILVFATLHNGGTAGRFNFQWAQGTANGTNTTIERDSVMVLWPKGKL